MAESVIRPLQRHDAAVLAALVTANSQHLAPWDPVRTPRWYTVAGQAETIDDLLDAQSRGLCEPFVVLDGDAVVGRITISHIVRGPLQSGVVGYWLSADRTGRGLMSAALGEVVTHAFEQLGLHRLEAGTLLHNHASQKVLRNNGFEQFGLAPSYLRIAGRWQDHLLFQRINPDEGLSSI